jgi:hypothetical protein
MNNIEKMKIALMNFGTYYMFKTDVIERVMNDNGVIGALIEMYETNEHGLQTDDFVKFLHELDEREHGGVTENFVVVDELLARNM